MPAAGPARSVVSVPGNHGLTTDIGAVREAVREWLAGRPELASR
jgi:hypothetical protein